MNTLYKTAAQKIRDSRNTLPSLALEKQFELQPKLKEQYKERHKQLYLEDTRFHLSYLAESISANEPILFTEYLSWAKTFFSSLPIEESDLVLNFELIRDTLVKYLTAEEFQISTKFMNAGIEKFKQQLSIPPTYLLETNPLREAATNYLNFLIDGNKRAAHELIIKTYQTGTSIKEIYLNIFQVTQKETGRLWQIGKIEVAQEHFITAATQLIMSQLYPYMFSSAKKEHTIIVSCVNGELHEIGARMVADLFELDGWNSYYFGANTPQRSLMNAIEIYKPRILAISATMTFNLTAVSELIETVKMNPKLNKVKILVGGYPFTIVENLWQSTGADGFALDAEHAINLAYSLLS